MEIRRISETYSVSPQIEPGDIPAIAAAGFKTVLCNRPDGENPPALYMAEIQAAVEASGLVFEDNPFDQSTFGPDAIAKQKALLDTADAPVFAYCASGTRCSMVWAFTQAGKLPTDDILASIKAAGYQLDHLRDKLDAFANA